LLLLGRLEEELADFAHAQAEDQVIIRAVFVALVAGAGGFAAGEELLGAGGAQEFWRGTELVEEGQAALAEGEGGFAFKLEYLSHIYF
jgi:hypothetical protein